MKCCYFTDYDNIISLKQVFLPSMEEKEILKKYLPEGSVNLIFEWIKDKQVHLKISKQRKTKLGDYRPPMQYPNHRISVNHNLNKYSFLITFVHEYAHLLVWENNKNLVNPHGEEWKMEYQRLMYNFLHKGIFPDDIENILSKSIVNSKAASTSDMQLSRILKKYDAPGLTTLEELEENTFFVIEGGRKFKKGPKQRTRYKCQNLDNKRYYFVHALTPVVNLSTD